MTVYESTLQNAVTTKRARGKIRSIHNREDRGGALDRKEQDYELHSEVFPLLELCYRENSDESHRDER